MDITAHKLRQLQEIAENLNLGYGKIAAYSAAAGIFITHSVLGVLVSANSKEFHDFAERIDELNASIAQRETARNGAPTETLPFVLPNNERELHTRLKFGLAMLTVYGAIAASVLGYGLSAKKGHYWPLAIPVVTNTITALASSRKQVREVALEDLQIQVSKLEQKLADFDEE